MHNRPDESSEQPRSESLPASVSNQNGEEAEPGHGTGGASGAGAETNRGQRPGSESDEAGSRGGGESGEGSQSTGNPTSAG